MELTDHEKALAKLLSSQNKALLGTLCEAERTSLSKYVDVDNVAAVESAIGQDHEIEAMLFWDKGGKFDDAEWSELRPLDTETSALHESTKSWIGEKRKMAVACQRRSDLTLLSQFNPGLLFTGATGAMRCDQNGVEAPGGGYFRGVELRMIGSVEDQVNSLTIWPEGEGRFTIQLGPMAGDTPQGILVNTGDPFSLIQAIQLVERDFTREGLEAKLCDIKGNTISLDVKAIRKAARQGEALPLPSEMYLHLKARAVGIENAFKTAEIISQTIYKRFGLEIEIFNLGRKYGNFFLARNETFDQFLPHIDRRWKGMVFLTATLECRRCRREMELFRDMARDFPEIRFALVNMNAPHAHFHERVFGDMAGGDPDRFVLSAKGVTPFTIVYSPDDSGRMCFREYLATGKDEKPPGKNEVYALIRRHCTPGK
jgi:hypothetical protein